MNLYKKRENHNFKNERDKLQDKIKKTEGVIERLTKEMKELETKIIDIQKEAEGNHQKQLNKFKIAIRPLEEAVNTVEEHKLKLEDKINEFEDRVFQLKD